MKGWYGLPVDPDEERREGRLPISVSQGGVTAEENSEIQKAIQALAGHLVPILVGVLARGEKAGIDIKAIPGIDVEGVAIYSPQPEISPTFFFHFYLKPPEVEATLKRGIYNE